MDVDEDDDFYAGDDAAKPAAENLDEAASDPGSKPKEEEEDEDLEEGEEEDEEGSDGSDSV
jgi:hypothetical protein